jgi:hypothetical protein
MGLEKEEPSKFSSQPGSILVSLRTQPAAVARALMQRGLGFVPLPGMVGYGATVPRFRGGGGSDPPGAPCYVILGGWVGPPWGIILREFPYFT